MADSNDSTMTPEERAKLLGAELGRYTDELVAAIGTSGFPKALGNFLAAALSRVTSLAAGAIVLYDQRMAAAEREIGAAHRRSNGNAARVSQAHIDIGLVSDRVHEIESKIVEYLDLVHRLAVDVEQLKERQAGSDGEQ